MESTNTIRPILDSTVLSTLFDIWFGENSVSSLDSSGGNCRLQRSAAEDWGY
jgi:hypothetical protein